MAKSMRTTIRKNVMFNAARAHINQNDGFGGEWISTVCQF
jgi:hypothetical protein